MKKRKLWIIPLAVLAVLLAGILYLLCHDPGVPVGTWTPDEAYSVTEEKTTRVEASELRYLNIAPYQNPETIRLRDGWLYAAVDGGSIIRLREDGTGLEEVLNTGGAILGFDFDTSGNLYFCDCRFQGEAAVCVFDGQSIQTLPIAGLTYPDALCLDEEHGILYLSNASCVRVTGKLATPMEAYMIDMMAHTNTGSVVSFDLGTEEQRTVAEGFSFANGLQLSEDGRFLLVNETSENHIWRVSLDSGEKEILLCVPGYPDNLYPAKEGYWSGLSGACDPSYSSLAEKPLLRKAIVNLPPFAFTAVTGSSTGGNVAMIRYDAEGNLLQYLLCEGSGFTVTGGAETGERLYLESITSADRICYLER